MQQAQMQQAQNHQQAQMQQVQNHQQVQNQAIHQMTPMAKADELIRSRMISAQLNGLTQSKFLGIMVLLLTIMVCFQSYLNYFKIVYYSVFIVYTILLLICIFYY